MFVGDHSWCTLLEFSEFSAVFEFEWFCVAVSVACLLSSRDADDCSDAVLPKWKYDLFSQQKEEIIYFIKVLIY